MDRLQEISQEIVFHQDEIDRLRKERQSICPHNRIEHIYVTEPYSPRGFCADKVIVDDYHCLQCGLRVNDRDWKRYSELAKLYRQQKAVAK